MRRERIDKERCSSEFRELRDKLLARYTVAGIADIAQRSTQSIHQYALKPTSAGFRKPKPEVFERLRAAVAALEGETA